MENHEKGGFNGEAYCRFCNCSITARHSSLVGHEGTGKHEKKAPPQGQFVKNALAFFWHFSGCVWHFFGTFLTSLGIFSDFQSGNPA